MNIDKVLHAFRDWTEAQTKLEEAQSEYTGYSPSYHLRGWYEAESKAKQHAEIVLNEYIREAVSELGEKQR